jgi:hypothetical protein
VNNSKTFALSNEFDNEYISENSNVKHHHYIAVTEFHLIDYLLKLVHSRNAVHFIYKLNQINHSFRSFNNHNLFMYVIATKDESVGTLVAKELLRCPNNFDQLRLV